MTISTTATIKDSSFLKACSGEKTQHTPIWIMRQAGRYLPEYRKVREKIDFLTLCKTPELAAQVTVEAVNALNVDAAIIFADILLPLEAMGSKLEYATGGPIIHNPVRHANDVQTLKQIDIAESLPFTLEAIKVARQQLPQDIPLIGFAGAPFTLASYLIEGGSSKQFDQVKKFMYSEPVAWNSLMEKLSAMTVDYLNAQTQSGAQVIQIFDSWAGCLSQADYKSYVLPHMKSLISNLSSEFPVIHFATGSSHLLELMQQAGHTVIGLDWRISLAEARQRLGQDTAVQGNLDPTVLLADKAQIKAQAQRVLDEAADKPGHIFNLGHGVLPKTPPDNVKYLIEYVHEASTHQ
jgi:uroporphyrinogen decarboxylase